MKTLKSINLLRDQHILLFDGLCVLCSKIVQFVTKRDKSARFRFVSLQSDTGRSLLIKYGLPGNYFKSVVYIRGEKYFLKSSAILHLLKEIGGVWRFFFILMIIPRFMRDFLYDIMAKSRYRIFGRNRHISE